MADKFKLFFTGFEYSGSLRGQTIVSTPCTSGLLEDRPTGVYGKGRNFRFEIRSRVKVIEGGVGVFHAPYLTSRGPESEAEEDLRGSDPSEERLVYSLGVRDGSLRFSFWVRREKDKVPSQRRERYLGQWELSCLPYLCLCLISLTQNRLSSTTL